MESDTSEQAAPASSERPSSTRQSSSKHIHSHGPSHRHSKPWTARLYRKHDAKHHRAEPEEEAAPLLAEAAPEETDDEPEQDHRHRRGCCGHVAHDCKWFGEKITAGVKWTGGKIGDFAVGTAECVKDNAKAAAEGTKKAGRACHNNPKIVMSGIIAVLTVISSTFGAGLAYDRIKLHPTPAELCTSPACVRASNYLLQNLDPSLVDQNNQKAIDFTMSGIDPCTDFDKFVCGGFDQLYDLREDQGDMSTDTLIAEENEFTFKRIIEQPMSKVPAKDAALMKMLKKAYNACMDSSQATGLKPLQGVVDHIKDLISMVGPSRGGPRRLQTPVIRGGNIVKGLDDAVAFLVKLGIDVFVKFDIISGLSHPDKHIVKLSPVLAIGLPAPDFYRDAGLVKEYRQLASHMLALFYDVHVNSTTILGRHRNIRATVLDLAEGVVDLEVKLAIALPLPKNLIDAPKAENELPITQIEKIIHQLDLGKVIKEVAPQSYSADDVYVASPEYLERLSFVLQATPIEVIQAFMVWKAIQGLSDLVDDPRLESLKEFKAKVKGAAQEQPNEPWRYCVREVNDMLGWAMSRFFGKHSWDDEKLDVSNTVTDQIKYTLGEILGNVDWIEEDVRDIAVKKVLAAHFSVGAPSKFPLLKSPGSVEDYYDKIKLNSSHFANKLESSRFKTIKEWSKLDKTTAAQWDIFADEVDSYYDYSANKAVLPAGLLQAPLLFDGSVPEYVTYGSLGFSAAHELAHAVGQIGSHFAPDGKLQDWWDEKSRAAYDDKAKCFAKQYSQFTVDGPDKVHKVKGNFTVAENMADAAALRTAFLAWQKMDADEPNRALPGLQKYTKDQLFFISFASGLCSKTSPEKAAQRILTDTQAPKPARILGSVANSREFREAFQCESEEPTCALF